jgi:hypothetical protein
MRIRLYGEIDLAIWGIGFWVRFRQGFKFDLHLGPIWLCLTSNDMMLMSNQIRISHWIGNLVGHLRGKKGE